MSLLSSEPSSGDRSQGLRDNLQSLMGPGFLFFPVIILYSPFPSHRLLDVIHSACVHALLLDFSLCAAPVRDSAQLSALLSQTLPLQLHLPWPLSTPPLCSLPLLHLKNDTYHFEVYYKIYSDVLSINYTVGFRKARVSVSCSVTCPQHIISSCPADGQTLFNE